MKLCRYLLFAAFAISFHWTDAMAQGSEKFAASYKMGKACTHFGVPVSKVQQCFNGLVSVGEVAWEHHGEGEVWKTSDPTFKVYAALIKTHCKNSEAPDACSFSAGVVLQDIYRGVQFSMNPADLPFGGKPPPAPPPPKPAPPKKEGCGMWIPCCPDNTPVGPSGQCSACQMAKNCPAGGANQPKSAGNCVKQSHFSSGNIQQYSNSCDRGVDAKITRQCIASDPQTTGKQKSSTIYVPAHSTVDFDQQKHFSGFCVGIAGNSYTEGVAEQWFR